MKQENELNMWQRVESAQDLSWELGYGFQDLGSDAPVRASQWAYGNTKCVVVMPTLGGLRVYNYIATPILDTQNAGVTLTFPFRVGDFVEAVRSQVNPDWVKDVE